MIGGDCPETGHAKGLLSPQLDTAMINSFLKPLAATLSDDEHAAMLWDGAGFHRFRQYVVRSNVALFQLPLCSPKLTPHWCSR